jgi:esterase
MTSTLQATRVAQHDDAPRALVMLHGIYGRGRNWQGIARSLVSARPDCACWLVDLPYHGQSGPGAHGDTIEGLAQDVTDWASLNAIAPVVVLGHSYGGKVALALAAHAQDRPMQTWVIDSTPEVKDPSGSAWDMLRVVRSLPDRFATREEAQGALIANGYDLPVAQWMGTNLVRDGEQFRWQLDFNAMERLLLNFFSTDMWQAVEHPSPLHDVHILKAAQSNAISPDAVTRIARATGPHVHLHHRDGGHWIHAERPDVVTALLLEHLP